MVGRLIFLIDTNVWLELLLEQEKASDTIEDSSVVRVRLDTGDLKQVLTVRRQFQLDFDDAYQYVAAEKYGYTLVSFDADFDRTERGKKTPAEVLQG